MPRLVGRDLYLPQGLEAAIDRRPIGLIGALDVEVEVADAVGVDDGLVLGRERVRRIARVGELLARGPAEGHDRLAARRLEGTDALSDRRVGQSVVAAPRGDARL